MTKEFEIIQYIRVLLPGMDSPGGGGALHCENAWMCVFGI